MVRDADEDTPIRKLIRSLLIKTCSADYPRQQVLYMLAGGGKGFGLLRITNATFVRASLGNVRKLRSTPAADGSVVLPSVLDRYTKRKAVHEALTLYMWLLKDSNGKRHLIPMGRLCLHEAGVFGSPRRDRHWQARAPRSCMPKWISSKQIRARMQRR